MGDEKPMVLGHECVRHLALLLLIVFDAVKIFEMVVAHREGTWIDPL